MKLSAVSRWFRSSQVRRSLAFASVVLATGGLVLHRASATGFEPACRLPSIGSPVENRFASTFRGPGLHGSVALSHAYVASNAPTSFFAEVRLVADPDEDKIRAPISLAVVLDTSGSMSGDKIEEAKRAVLRLLGDMRAEDQIAVVQYASTSQLLQPLARVGTVRADLESRIRSLSASGGTNIPAGLEQGLQALSESDRGRVKRVVLVSDGLDDSRSRAEQLARQGFSSGTTISSLGIGLDFDESYMGALATSGHGNFAFVKDSQALAKFLTRELEETSKTTVENATVRVSLPDGVRFVSASGADAAMSDGAVELSFGSLFAGDERRAIVELTSDGSTFDRSRDRSASLSATLSTRASWSLVSCNAGGSCGRSVADGAPLKLAYTTDATLIEQNRDGAVLASATSVLASRRQIEAAEAYAHGDVARATRLVEENEQDLQRVRPMAPAAVVGSLDAQLDGYRETKKGFASAAPSAATGRSLAKAAAAKEMGNLSRSSW